jgi:hypothetical protein
MTTEQKMILYDGSCEYCLHEGTCKILENVMAGLERPEVEILEEKVNCLVFEDVFGNEERYF